MSKTQSLFRDDFPPADYGTWRPLVEKELGGASFEKALGHRLADGFAIEPLYSEDTAPTATDPARFPGVFPFTRGTDLPHRGASWFFGSEIADGDPAAARVALEGDLELGVDLLWLRIGPPDGLRFDDEATVAALLAGVEPKFLRLMLDAGTRSAAAADLLFGWARGAGIPHGELRGCLGIDPLGTLATAGRLPTSLEDAWRALAERATFCLAEAPEMRASLVSTAPWHRAGATPAWELGLGLAAGLETLRGFERHGFDPTRAAHQITFAHELGSEIFLEIAKLRAMRLLWSKVVAASGAGEAAAGGQQHIAFSSSVAATQVDPWVNLLRSTAQTFAAAVGGADGMVVRPWDALLGRPEAPARRFALSSQYVLAQESHLRAVADPAGGSWALEALTDGLAREAWKIAQEVDRQGGLGAALVSGWVQAELAELAAARRKDVARRKTQIVGTSAFPLVGEERPARAERPVWSGEEESIAADAASAPPLEVYRPAADFEALRLAADASGVRPRIFFANLGKEAESRARAEFSAGVFPVAGFEIVASGSVADPEALAAAFAASGCRAAVLNSSDEIYAAQGEAAARALKAAGCERLLLAGRPGENEARLREAGIDGFVYLGADIAAVLGDLLNHSLEVAK